MKIQYVMTNSLFALFFWLISSLSVVQAADLVFTPATPIVEIGQQIPLSVSGTSGDITWTPSKGQIQGAGNQVTYIAPAQAGTYGVMVVDGAGNGSMVTIIVTLPMVSLENANWKVFANRSDIQALALSEDEETLWVGTNGGLEQRDLTRDLKGDLKGVFVSPDGLPNNEIQAIVNDNNGGLWVGTAGGLAHFSANGKIEAFTTENSELPNNLIKSLLADGNGGVWIGVQYGVDDLAHLRADGEWEIFTEEDSGLKNYAYSLLSDGNDGIWMGNSRGLVHFHANGTWTVFNTENSELPDNNILSLQSDGSNGIWVGTDEGLAHFHADGTTWSIFNGENSELPNNRITFIQSDGKGGIWVGTGGMIYSDWLGPYSAGRLTHFHRNGATWSIFNVENSELASNRIYSVQSDGNGGVLLGTSKGIAHLKSDKGTLEFFDSNYYTKKFTIPSNNIQVLFPSQDGVLVGTDNGLVHVNVDGTSKPKPSFLDNFSTVSAIESDNADGVWVGTESGLYHLYADGTQAIFNTEDSDLRVYSLHAVGDKGVWAGTNFGLFPLAADNHDGKTLRGTPDRHVRAIQPDNKGGIWTSMGRVVLHINADDTETLFHFENSEMPNKYIRSLHADGHGGVWVGLRGSAKITPEGVVDPGNCLVHIQADETLKVIERDDSGPQLCSILSIQTDGGNGGIWVGFGSGGANVNGIFYGGLGYLDAEGNWEFFDTNNSALPINDVTSLLSDESGGLWVGTSSGLAHLTFGKKIEVCTQVNPETCKTLLTGKRAAIIIAGGGAQSENTLWDTTAAISNNIYKMFNIKGFDNDEIYYISPKFHADFNGDGKDDCIVDAPATPICRIKSVDNPIPERPMTVDDIRNALAWAKERGKFNQPLYLFFINHGGTDRFKLADDSYLNVAIFKDILDDYQEETGNELVLLIDTCYSGVLLEKLKAPNRAIISSTGNGLAYFDRVSKQGFSRFFSKGLLKGMNFGEAFDYAKGEQDKLVESTGEHENMNLVQIPKLYDGKKGQWLRNLFINNFSLVAGDITLTVETLTASTNLSVGQSQVLQAKVSLAPGTVQRVWAIIKPPKMNLVIDTNGTPILAFPRFNLSSTEEENVWQTTWNDAVYNGDYEISFYAEDNDGNIASSEKSVIINVTGGVEPPEQANLQIVLEKDRYRPGELLKAELIENLGWGYDLYAALVTSSGFVTIKNTNQFSPVNEAKKWLGQRIQNSHTTLVDFTLPEGLPTGEYCLYGILSPERENVIETLALDLWVMEQRCFEVY